MKLGYRITEDDYVAAMRLATPIGASRIVAYCCVAFAYAHFFVFRPNGFHAVSAGLLAAAAVFIVGWRLVIAPILRRRNYRQYQSIHDEVVLELLEDGLRFSTANSYARLSWGSILRWRDGKTQMLIYIAPHLFNIVPKSAGEAADIETLWAALAKHVGDPT